MNPLPQHANNTLNVAKETLAISEKSGDRSMRIIGLVMLGMTGLATVVHACHAIYRDVIGSKGKKDHGQGDPLPPNARHRNPDDAIEQTPARQQGTEQSWVRRARLTDRPPTGEDARPAYRDRHSHAQQR